MCLCDWAHMSLCGHVRISPARLPEDKKPWTEPGGSMAPDEATWDQPTVAGSGTGTPSHNQ